MHNYGMAVDISICKASWNDATWHDGATRLLDRYDSNGCEGRPHWG